MPKKILVVDDDQDLVFMIKETLLKQGYEVVTASDGAQTLRLLKTETPDLIIADLTMPGMSGWHLSMKIRQDERFKTTPIIILSGLLERDAQPEKHEAATAYVVKPFDIFKLMDKVKELLAAS